MRVLIMFKFGEGGERTHTRTYGLESAEAYRLTSDFLTCLNDGAGGQKGGSYKCIDVDTNQSRELILRFDDILYLECIHPDGQAENITGPLSKGTGPLQSRLASTGSGEP